MAALRAARHDRLLTNSALIFLTTMMMALGGAVFWIIAARLATPHAVGLAGSLAAAGDSLALFAQLGFNIAVLRTLPISSRRASDVVYSCTLVAGAGAVLGLGYALLLPWTSPRLSHVVSSPVTIVVFCVLVAMTALNVLTDNIFLAINRVRDYVRLNGILLGVVKCALCVVLAGVGAFGLYSSIGTAVLVCGVASLWQIFRHTPGPRRLSPSPELRATRTFALAGYVTYVLTVVPLLVFPLIVINDRGTAAGATYFICFQVVALLNSVVLAVGNVVYAECERATDHRHALARKGALTLVGTAALGSLAMLVLAPYFLDIFGPHYVHSGTSVLRVLVLAVVGAAFNYAGVIRMRLASNLTVMILVQLVSTAVMLGLAVLLVPHGTVYVGVAWGVGHAVGGALGFALTATVARFSDTAPVPAGAPVEVS